MKVWITSFVILFGLAQLYQLLEPITLPLPVFIVGGVLLAIASNYDKRAGLPFRLTQPPKPQIPTPQTPNATTLPNHPAPTFQPGTPTPRPLSFNIREIREADRLGK
ncbi:MAG: hypothetical protein VKJ46_07465 [Leptolyngbyaceae bacterium]|nr:hypothetical protein [Leptolyngbyaceae bacterium]